MSISLTYLYPLLLIPLLIPSVDSNFSVIAISLSKLQFHPPLTKQKNCEGATGASLQSDGLEDVHFQPCTWGPPHVGSRTPDILLNDCPSTDYPLTVLMPSTNWSRTLTSNPTFWFYVPYSADQISYGEFIFRDELSEDENSIDIEIEFTLPETPGFISVTLPESTPPLDPETEYHWFFSVFCGEDARASLYVDGWVRRIEGDAILQQQLDEGDRLTDYQLYRDNFIWLDAIDALMQERLTQPNNPDLEAEWIDLLKDGEVNDEEGAINIEQIPRGPIVGPVDFRD